MLFGFSLGDAELCSQLFKKVLLARFALLLLPAFLLVLLPVSRPPPPGSALPWDIFRGLLRAEPLHLGAEVLGRRAFHDDVCAAGALVRHLDMPLVFMGA